VDHSPVFFRNIRILGVNLFNPWDSPNTDGIDPESVNGLEIAGVSFSWGMIASP
jgi:polygalacturonase